jgi:asparagine synthase (glutamine-hydrolysing)
MPRPRTLAGIFDPQGRADRARLNGALGAESAVAEAAPLHVAYTGARAQAHDDLLCLLEGYVDNAGELACELGLPPAEADGGSPEALLAGAYRHWGNELPARLRGDFALLIWDGERGEGLIARDQLGVRSIFLHRSGELICFASEIRSLLQLLPRRPSPDRESVAHWIGVSLRPGSHTLYEGIRRLDPGSALLLSGAGARERRYWAPRYVEPLEQPAAGLARETRAAIDRAVGRRLLEHGPTGVLLSGGLDSASIAASAAGQATGRVRAYSGVFPDHPAVDESQLIAELTDSLSLQGTIARARAGGIVASVVESVSAWQLPPAGWGDFWALPLLRQAHSDGVEVMLDGYGGDELFGARIYLLADLLRAGHPLRCLRAALELPGAGDRPSRKQALKIVFERGLLGALDPRLQAAWPRSVEQRGLPSWLLASSAKALISSDDPYAWKRLEGPRWWAHIAHGLTRGVEETGVFEHERHRSALAGLGMRHPFFDLDLVELLLRAPPQASFDRHRNRPLLRAAMAGSLPDSVRLRPRKALFDSLLLDSLHESDGALVRELLTSPGAQIRAYVDVEGMRSQLLDSPKARSSAPFRSMHRLWRLLSAECWLRAQTDPQAPILPPRPAPSGVEVELRGSYLFPT